VRLFASLGGRSGAASGFGFLLGHVSLGVGLVLLRLTVPGY